MCVCWRKVYAHCYCNGKARRKCCIPLEAELLAIVSSIVWVLGTEPRSSGTAVHTFNQSPQAISKYLQRLSTCLCLFESALATANKSQDVHVSPLPPFMLTGIPSEPLTYLYKFGELVGNIKFTLGLQIPTLCLVIKAYELWGSAQWNRMDLQVWKKIQEKEEQQ